MNKEESVYISVVNKAFDQDQNLKKIYKEGNFPNMAKVMYQCLYRHIPLKNKRKAEILINIATL